MPRALKVFRTPIGFHDAYVAAPSRKAALTAWGADADLFARGVAEQVTDAAAMRAPLARPGEIIRVRRGTDAEHLAALSKPEPAPTARTTTPKPAKPARRSKPKPRPSRAPLDRAEAAVTAARDDLAAMTAEIARREEALKEERRTLEKAGHDRLATLEAARAKAKSAYDAKIRAWSGA